MSADVDRVFNFLKSRSLHASRLWVEGCVEYYKSQQLGSQFSIFDLQNFAVDQWLLVDLRSMGVGCFPRDLCNHKDITINGSYAVQVESVRDISTPAYSQLLLVRGVSTENCEATKKPSENWEPKPGRVLKLTIFDGVQEIVAMEYSLIRELDKNLTPGMKMLIIGPVRCRRGIFLLEQRNVKILGGEVDTLITVNASENILARALSLPENPDPYGTQETAPESVAINQPTLRTLPGNLPQSNQDARRNNLRTHELQPPVSLDFPDDDELQCLEFADVQLVHQANDCQEIEEVLLDDEDDDLLLQLPDVELASQVTSGGPEQRHKMERESAFVTSQPSTSSHTLPLRCSSYGKEAEDRIKRVTPLAAPPPSSSLARKSSSGQGKITAFLQRPSAATSSTAIERKDEILVKLPSYFFAKEVGLDPFVYLVQLVSSPSLSGIYPIKGFLVTLLSKLEDKKGCWHLLAKLSDGSANVDVNFYSEVLEEIIGFSVPEMHAMRQRMSGNPAIKEKLKHSFQLAKKKLYELNCIFYLQFYSESKMPSIVNIENISSKHFSLLKARSCQQ